MTKRHIIVGVVASVLFSALVFGFGAFMVAKAQTWSSENRMLAVPVQSAVNAGYFIQSHPFGVAIAVVGLCFGLVWLAGKNFVKR